VALKTTERAALFASAKIMKKILLLLIAVTLFVSGCSCLDKGRGLTEQDILLLHANPHVPLVL
jgi:hypothetical protein